LRYDKKITRTALTILILALALAVTTFSAQAFAAQITGTVTNGTSSKPAVGVDVTLLSLNGGMEETGRAKTNAQGHFAIDMNDPNVQHLIKVDFQGASYFKMVPPGTTSADTTIYDAAAKVDNIIGEGHIFQFQTGDGKLEVRESFTLRNESNPPRTKTGDRTFEISLPEGAQLKEGSFLRPGGMPLASMPSATKTKGRFAFNNPLRPGQSQFQITYTLPYGGSQDFVIKPDITMAEVGIMLPKSMQFKPSGEDFLQANEESGMATFVAKNVTVGKKLQFSVSGEGQAPAETQQSGGQMPAQGARPSGPGGGLGTPNDSPDPLSGFKWYVIGGIAVIMVGGAVFAMRKKLPGVQAASGEAVASRNPAAAGRRTTQPASTRAAPAGAPASSSPASSSPTSSGPGNMMDVLKEELFQLETDRLQGKITQQEYDSSKAGLETLLRRQLKH
jgi:5-hydroxyisourate hydrolase-like protein (transthyretin family)